MRLDCSPPQPHTLRVESCCFVTTVRAKVKKSTLGPGAVAMLRLLLVVVVASYAIDDDLISECQVCVRACSCRKVFYPRFSGDPSRNITIFVLALVGVN